MVRATRARISTRLVASLLMAWRDMGIDIDAVVEHSAVPRDVLDDPDAYVSTKQLGRLGLSAYQASDDVHLALHAAERYRPGSIPVLDYLILSAANVKEAIELYVRYDRLLQNVSVTTLEISGERTTLRHEATGLAPANRAASENALASVVVFGRYLTAKKVQPLEVRFVHEAPLDTSELERVFVAPIKFRQPDNAVVFETSYLNLPLLHADSGLSVVLQQHADDLLAKLEGGSNQLTANVRRSIVALLPSGDATLPKVAARLQQGERTLRRKLRQEGTSFREALESVQHEVARHHLRQRAIAVDELALILGFSDGRAFRRAFKRWQGTSPADYRRGFGGG